MKNFFKLSFLLGIIFLTSCGKSVIIDTTEDLKGINDIIYEHLDENALVERVVFSCSGSSSVNWDVKSLSVLYQNSNGEFKNLYIPLDLGGNVSDKDAIAHSPGTPTQKVVNGKIVKVDPPKKGRKLKDYDFTTVATNVQKGITLAANNEVTEANGLDNYTINFSEDPSLDEHSFCILKKVEGSTKLKDKKIQTSYYKYCFYINDKGEITKSDFDE